MNLTIRRAAPTDVTNYGRLLGDELPEVFFGDYLDLLASGEFGYGPDPGEVALLASDGNGRVVGAALAAPPVSSLTEANLPEDEYERACSDLSKLAAIAVRSDSRRRGVGTNLLLSVATTLANSGHRRLFGQFHAKSSDLAKFYASLGFRVLPPEAPLVLPPWLALQAEPNYQFFLRTLLPLRDRETSSGSADRT